MVKYGQTWSNMVKHGQTSFITSCYIILKHHETRWSPTLPSNRAPPKSSPFCWVCPGARENKLADPSAYGEYDTFWLRIWWICWDCFTLILKFTDVSLHKFVGDLNWSLWQAFRPGHRAFEHATVAGSCKVTDSAGATFVDVHCTGLAPSRRAKWVYTILLYIRYQYISLIYHYI